MPRVTGSQGSTTAADVRRAGLELIYRHGYEAMTLRQLAAEVGLQAASLYNHISTKQDLLYTLIRDHMLALLSDLELALSRAGDDTIDRLRAFVAHHLAYHMDKKREVFIANSELRALNADNRRMIVGLRRRYEERLIALLDVGVERGTVRTSDTTVAAYALLAMMTGACTWYKPDGRLSQAEVVKLHTDLMLHGCLAGLDGGDPG